MSKWSLSKKIWGILSLLIIAFIGCVYLALHSMKEISSNLNEVTSVYVKRDQITSDIKDDQRLMIINLYEQILETDPNKIAVAETKFKENIKSAAKDLEAYRKITDAAGIAFVNKFSRSLDLWLKETKKAQDLAAKNQNVEAFAVVTSAGIYLTEMKSVIDEMNHATAKQLDEKIAESTATSTQAIWLTLSISVTAIILSIAISFIALRAVTKAINEIVYGLFDSSSQVSSAAGQVATSSQVLSNATTEQAASLEETASSIEELNSMVAKNSENAGSASITSDESKGKAVEGKVVVEKMIQSMELINKSNNDIMNQVNHGNSRIAEIIKVIEEIAVKTNVINDIVFQTKLLSFNASVEAARAGEHGKGFAVVAEEIGNLATMSGKAAKEISFLLGTSTNRVNEIVFETRTTVEKLIVEGKQVVESGNVVAHQCGQVLEEIVHNVGSVSSMAKEIAQASIEQSLGVTEITKAMGQLDQVTQQNSATSEECASAAEELSAQAEVLRKAVEKLKVTIDGDNGHSSEANLTSIRKENHPIRRSHAA